MARNLTPQPDNLPEPRFPASLQNAQMLYDRDGDMLIIRLGSSRPATSVHIAGELWLRMDPVAGDVTGFEIEDFEAVFLKRHPTLGVIWSEIGADTQAQPSPHSDSLFIERILKLFNTLPHPRWRPSSVAG